MHILKIEEMSRLTVDEFRQAEKLPLRVVLDDVRSMHNVGSVFRTADAFRVEGWSCAASRGVLPTTRSTRQPLGRRTAWPGNISRLPSKP